MALQMAMNSLFFPTHSLKPTGFPPESSRSCRINPINSAGVVNAVWDGGEFTPEQGEIPLDSMPGLKHIVYTHQDQGTDDNKRPEYRWPEPRYTAKNQGNGNTMNGKLVSHLL